MSGENLLIQHQLFGAKWKSNSISRVQSSATPVVVVGMKTSGD